MQYTLLVHEENFQFIIARYARFPWIPWHAQEILHRRHREPTDNNILSTIHIKQNYIE